MKYEPDKGVSIYHAAQEAVKLAHENSREVELIFNDTTVYVSPRSHADDIAMIYVLKREVNRLKKFLTN